MHLVRRHPLPPRVCGRQGPLDFVIFNNPTCSGVDEEHPPRPQPALADDFARGQLQHTRFAGEHHQTIRHLPPTAWPQTVAVERGTNLHAVGERQRSRTIPGLHQACLIFVIGLEIIRHALMAAPRLWNQHAHRFLDRTAREHQHFEHVVEGGRVATAFADHRLDLVEIRTEHRMREHALAGVHPVNVAPHGVDLAVVGDVAERMRQVPGGEGVGAVALVHQSQGTVKAIV